MPLRPTGAGGAEQRCEPRSTALKTCSRRRISLEKGEPFHVPDFTRGQPSLSRSAALLMFSTGGEDERGETWAEEEEEEVEEGGGESCLNLRGARAGGGGALLLSTGWGSCQSVL